VVAGFFVSAVIADETWINVTLRGRVTDEVEEEAYRERWG